MNEVSLVALRTGRLYPPGNIPGTHFCQRLSLSHGSAAGKIMSVTPSGIKLATYRRAPLDWKKKIYHTAVVCVCVLTGLNRGFRRSRISNES